MYIEVKNFAGETVKLKPVLVLYKTRDFLGTEMPSIGIDFEDEDELPYTNLTVSFGEFIGLKNAAYVKTYDGVDNIGKRILELGLAQDTGLTKQSGYCEYPLWIFSEKFLSEIGGDKYQMYSNLYNEYMMTFENDDQVDEEE